MATWPVMHHSLRCLGVVEDALSLPVWSKPPFVLQAIISINNWVFLTHVCLFACVHVYMPHPTRFVDY